MTVDVLDPSAFRAGFEQMKGRGSPAGKAGNPRKGIGARHATRNGLEIHLPTGAPALPKIPTQILG
jgi:hypothetical protein